MATEPVALDDRVQAAKKIVSLLGLGLALEFLELVAELLCATVGFMRLEILSKHGAIDAVMNSEDDAGCIHKIHVSAREALALCILSCPIVT